MGLLRLFTKVLGMAADWYHILLIRFYFGPFIRKERDVIVVLPPGSGKTQLVIVTVVAIFLKDPGAHVIVLSNSEAIAHMICRNVMWLLQSDAIRAIRTIEFSKCTESQLTIEGNDGRVSLLAAGTRTVITGSRCDYLIVDDGVKDQAQALSSTMDEIWQNFQMVAETRILQKGRVCIVGTRWALSDFIGRVISRALANRLARQFHVISLALTNVTGRDSYEFYTGDDK